MAQPAQRVFPMLAYEDVGSAADWLTNAFGFEERERFADDEQARAAGATILSELEENQELGERRYRAEDVEGHRWMFVQAI
jgi:uncharacterized glyoxalase superfamily protein PhnB